MTSSETLPSHLSSPLPKSPLFLPTKMMASPLVATSVVAVSLVEQPDQLPSPISTPSSPPKNSKPSPFKSKKKGKVVDSPPRYYFETAYSHYFFEFEIEKLFERYITCGFILERPIKLDNFRALGVQKLVEDRGWESTVSNTPRFVPKVVHEFYINRSDNINVQG